MPRLMAAQFVKPFRKWQGNKNDRNDAEAIATAARQGNMRFVTVKTVDQQARLAWHRVREGYKAQALAISNRLRGLLAEFGVVVARSDLALRGALADDAIRRQLPVMLYGLLDDLRQHWQHLRERIGACDAGIAAHAKADGVTTRITMPRPGSGTRWCRGQPRTRPTPWPLKGSARQTMFNARANR